MNKVESLIKNLLTKKSPGGFTGEFNQIFKELMSILLKLFPKIEEEWWLQNSLYKARIILIPKPDKDTTRKLQAAIPDEYKSKNPKQNTSKLNSTAH